MAVFAILGGTAPNPGVGVLLHGVLQAAEVRLCHLWHVRQEHHGVRGARGQTRDRRAQACPHPFGGVGHFQRAHIKVGHKVIAWMRTRGQGDDDPVADPPRHLCLPAQEWLTADLFAQLVAPPHARGRAGSEEDDRHHGVSLSSPHPSAIGIKEGRGDHRGRAHLPQNFDLDREVLGDPLCRQEPERHGLLRVVRITTGGAEAYDRAVQPDWFIALHISIFRVDVKCAQFAHRAIGALGLCRRPSDEIGVLLPGDETVEARFCRCVIGRKLGHPRAKELIEPERHHRPHPERDHVIVGARLPKRGPKLPLGHGIAVYFKAQIAGIADPLDDTVGHADRHPSHVEELHFGDIGEGASL
mmetsp:Transcript_18046/g.27777  ORF Transcript_18046/g.27777 Transcript_18046/m.27777 type:complete len:357 (-) Transcript_18046:37-1107(-)